MRLSSKISLSGKHKNSFNDAFSTILDFSYGTLSDYELESLLTPSLKNIPDPCFFKNINEAMVLFLKHVFAGNKILIFGDYDVDGITSSVMLTRFFAHMGYTNFDILIPNRFEHGYGLSESAHNDILALNPGLVITVDNGINAVNEVANLRAVGVDVIITDHHTPTDSVLPDCPVIDPKIPGCTFPHKDISGVGVAFLFVIALRRKLREIGYWDEFLKEPSLVKDLDLVALGTVADQSPLKGLNRIFVHFGLKRIATFRESDYAAYSYLRALHKVFPNLRNYAPDSELVSFRIAPMLNAAGRLKSGMLSVKYMRSSTLEEAEAHLKELMSINTERTEIQEKMLEIAYSQAERQLSSGGLVLYDKRFHEGVTGLIAGKLSSEFGMPCIALANMQSLSKLKGSCRLPEGGSMLNILKHCSEVMTNYGGHDCAAGCVLPEENLEDFQRLFKQASLKEKLDVNTSEYTADYELTEEFLCLEFYNRIKHLEPHGNGNPRPTFLIKNVNLNRKAYKGKNFLKWTFAHNVEGILWNFDPQRSYTGIKNIIFEMKFNSFSRKGIQLMIKQVSI